MTDTDLTTFTDCLETLARACGYALDVDEPAVYFERVKDLPLSAVVDALVAQISACTFPALEALRGLVRVLPPPSPPAGDDADLFARRGDPMAREASQLMQRRLGGGMTQAEYVAACRDMDTKYPGLGWRHSADTLAQEYAAKLARDERRGREQEKAARAAQEAQP